jgi:prephenate dehydratase
MRSSCVPTSRAGAARTRPRRDGTGPTAASDRVTPPIVAYQGVAGAFSELAIRSIWGDAAVPLPCVAFGDVASAVLEGRAQIGILPVSNTIAGTVSSSVETIAASGLHVVGEHELRIELCLLGVRGATAESLRTVESHPVALRQCRRFLAEHPAFVAREAFDTAGAARDVAAANDATRGAIASASAARAYGLAILQHAVQDALDNTTRFALVALAPAHVRPSALDHALPSVNLGE